MRESLTLSAKEQQRSAVVSQWLVGLVPTPVAVALLGVSERSAWRLRAAMVARGAAGLAHGNRGRPSPRRLSDATRQRILALARTTYAGFNDSHLADSLAEDEGPARSSARPAPDLIAAAPNVWIADALLQSVEWQATEDRDAPNPPPAVPRRGTTLAIRCEQ